MNEDRPVGNRFFDQVHGELIVVEETGSEDCEGCAYRKLIHGGTRTSCTAPRTTGRCGASRTHGDSVIFAKLKDYAIFKLTGEWS
jgi:hypothetical protein